MKEEAIGNFAYIDNQNLYMATSRNPKPWNLDMGRLRVYLRDKYGVTSAFLFMGSKIEDYWQDYAYFEECGYELVFRAHQEGMHGLKKGNVDTDIVFRMMLDLYENSECGLLYLISGDGDYFRTVEHLLGKGRLGRILFPSRRNASSLYKAIPESYKAVLDTNEMRKKLMKR